MDQFKHFNPHTSNSRVYINRNFNRIGEDKLPTMSNSNVMYFNPNFSHRTNTQHYIAQQTDHTIRPKIHINPNFIRSKAQDATSAIPYTTNFHLNTNVSSAINAYNQISYTQPIQIIPDNRKNIQVATVSNSRYCLVRQNEKVKTPVVTSLPIKSTLQTVKVNKYKLVSLNSVKNSLSIDKKPTTRSIQPTQIKLNQTSLKSKYKISLKSALNVQNNRFKLIKRNSSETLQGVVRRVSITHNKNIMKTNFRPKKIVPGSMKKNNVPCPLYKKYGKCLRMIQGSCDYLHDKKHVSICRKFLKGACHDEQCLLSHDLTDKKMPTCYFYLQGNCTKEGCPYLHVKLNEKTKICPNFLKGYCENGDKCVHRHVNISYNSSPKQTKTKKRNLSTFINKNVPQRAKIFRTNTKNEDNTPNKEISNITHKELNNDQRYFKEATGGEISEEQYDLIKPTRCKLGSLPSFIQL